MSNTIVVSPPEHGVQLIRLNRPERRNALNVESIQALGVAFNNAEINEGVRCIVLTGNEKAFSAGADIAEMGAHGFAALERPERKAGWAAIERFTKPVVAAAEGLALGGGLELLLLADIAIVGRSAKLGLPETRIGLIPGDGGTQRLTRLVGRARATRMIFSGEPISGERAEQIGLVSQVVDDGFALAEAQRLAATIANGALSALKMAKAAILASAETSLAMGLGVERHAAARVFASPEGVEGLNAFLEKRNPRFFST
jgi:enoyl-CoA hydratase